MRGAEPSDIPDLPATLVILLERACDRFEAAWRAGLRPRMEEYLDQMPEAGRASLERALRRLERAYDRNGGGLSGPPTAGPAEAPSQTPGPPASAAPSIAGFEILGELGRGGMGVVYRAWQPRLNRSVALKMILAGAHAGPAALARFRTEAEAAARLQHPHIVPIFEVGDHAGMPFAVLELVDGGALSARLGGTPMPVRDAAELAKTLAGALDHAHGRGVIHRDLKPGNILMTTDGTPKVADFGLAKLVAGAGASPTQTGDVLGTPSYMAPEQTGAQSAVGPAADLYALGAILYELLTGRPPFKAETPQETIRQVISAEPVPPSRLRPLLPRDLETICLKCLEKDPARRYSSAAALAADLRRFLNGEPIEARPLGPVGRAWRWTRRHPALAFLAATVALLVVALSLGSTWAAARQRRLAAEAQRRRAQAEAISTFLIDDLLGQAAPENNRREDRVTVEQLLDRASVRIDGAFGNQPEVEAEIRTAIGETYLALGEYSKSQPHLRRALEVSHSALGPEHPRTLRIVRSLAELLRAQGALPEAEETARQALESARRVLGSDALGTISSLSNLALVLQARGKLAEAEPLFRQSFEASRRTLGMEHPETLIVMNNLAGLLIQGGQWAEAEPLLRRALDGRRRLFGPDHPHTLNSLHDLAGLLSDRGALAEAEPLYRQVYEARRRALGPEHRETLTTLNNLAETVRELCRWSEAELLHRQILEARLRILGPDHAETLSSLNNLALSLEAQGKWAEAEPLHRQDLASCLRTLGPDHPDTLISRQNLAQSLRARGALADAETMMRAALEGQRRVLGSEHRDTLRTAYWLAIVLRDRGRPDQAETLLRRVTESSRRALGPTHPGTLHALNVLAPLVADRGRFEEAEALAGEAVRSGRASLAADNPDLALLLATLGDVRTQAGQAAAAKPLLEEALAVCRKALPPGHAQTADTESRLGGCLLCLGQSDEAEPLLLGSYPTLATAPGVPPATIRRAVDRIVELYQARGRLGDAAAWRSRRLDLDFPRDPFAP
jgi:serine/threonine protein kinase/Tfp pilus assembly protein PilF